MIENQSQEESTIRSILKSEITWTLFVIAAGWSIIQTIILPIKEIQLNIMVLQKDIIEIKGYKAILDEQKVEIVKLQSEVDSHIKQTNK